MRILKYENIYQLLGKYLPNCKSWTIPEMQIGMETYNPINIRCNFNSLKILIRQGGLLGGYSGYLKYPLVSQK